MTTSIFVNNAVFESTLASVSMISFGRFNEFRLCLCKTDMHSQAGAGNCTSSVSVIQYMDSVLQYLIHSLDLHHSALS